MYLLDIFTFWEFSILYIYITNIYITRAKYNNALIIYKNNFILYFGQINLKLYEAILLSKKLKFKLKMKCIALFISCVFFYFSRYSKTVQTCFVNNMLYE